MVVTEHSVTGQDLSIISYNFLGMCASCSVMSQYIFLLSCIFIISVIFHFSFMPLTARFFTLLPVLYYYWWALLSKSVNVESLTVSVFPSVCLSVTLMLFVEAIARNDMPFVCDK